MTTRKLQVVHVITGLGAGGAENQLLSLQAAIAESGIEQQVISLQSGGTLRDTFRQKFGEVTELGANRGQPPFRLAWKLHQILRRREPDVIHAWMYHACAVASVVPSRAPLIWGIRHGLDSPQHLRPATKYLVRVLPIVRFRPAAIVFNSHSSRIQHLQIGYPASKSIIVRNGVNTGRFTPNRAQRANLLGTLGGEPGTFVVGYVGRLHRVKGWDLFCEVAARVRGVRSDVMFVIAGAGDDRDMDALHQTIAKFELADSVRLIGFQPDVVPLMQGMDLLISPSRSEGFSNVIAEAMACGVPCVVTNVGESASIVGPCGAVVDRIDAELIAGATIRMLELGHDRLNEAGLAARQRVIEQFSIARSAAHYSSIYRHCLRADGNALPSSM